MTGRVTVDDQAAFLARFENGVMGTFEATFEDGYRCQAVIDAEERSVESRKWTTPEIYLPKIYEPRED
jgi:predicted dehydrogenase